MKNSLSKGLIFGLVLFLLTFTTKAQAICSEHDTLISYSDFLERNNLTNCIEEARKEKNVKSMVLPDGQVSQKGTEIILLKCEKRTVVLSLKFPQQCPGGYKASEISMEIF